MLRLLLLAKGSLCAYGRHVLLCSAKKGLEVLFVDAEVPMGGVYMALTVNGQKSDFIYTTARAFCDLNRCSD
jgi:hypothetical protein